MGGPTGSDRVDTSDGVSWRGSNASIGTAQIGATMASNEMAMEVFILGMDTGSTMEYSNRYEKALLTNGTRKVEMLG